MTSTTPAETNRKVDHDLPIPLTDLRPYMSKKTYDWIQRHQQEEAAQKAQEEEDSEQDEAAMSAALFHSNNDDDEEEEDEYFKERFLRVQEWWSSRTNPDGISTAIEAETDAVHIHYILSDASGGHGDDVWAASRHVANLLADSKTCRCLLQPLFEHGDIGIVDVDVDAQHHSLQGLTVVELGAGAGIPSWTAMHCGASIVCTDQAIPDRIYCLAECAKRNHEIVLTGKQQRCQQAVVARVCPYNWGESIQHVLESLSETETAEQSSQAHSRKIDVVIAADCIYMPEFHVPLLDSIHKLLSTGTAGVGVALLPFALHGNIPDDLVWQIKDLAKSRGFLVEVLESQQLTPQSYGMDPKRGFVHMIRLTLLRYNKEEQKAEDVFAVTSIEKLPHE